MVEQDSRDQPVRLSVRVIPRSSRNTLEWEDATLKVRLTAPPVEGAANTALLKFLATRLRISRRDLLIVHGNTGRQKILEIHGLSAAEVHARLTKEGG